MLYGPPKFRWLTYLASLPTITLALGVSLFIHAIVLSIHFKLPEALNRATAQALDVILVNSRHASKPENAQAKAQANLDGGGNTEEPRRATTPLPPTRQSQPGNELTAAQQRVVQLEAQQREIMTRTGAQRSARSNTEQKPTEQVNEISGRDLATSARSMVQLEAEIARDLDAYNQRPRRKNIGARAEEYRFAQYVEDWRQKVERVGNINYPDSARGKLYGNLVLSVAIKSDGSLDRVEVSRSSGHKVLDEAAVRIVRLAAPYAVFPDVVRRDTDIIEITRTWSFTGADQLQQAN